MLNKGSNMQTVKFQIGQTISSLTDDFRGVVHTGVVHNRHSVGVEMGYYLRDCDTGESVFPS